MPSNEKLDSLINCKHKTYNIIIILLIYPIILLAIKNSSEISNSDVKLKSTHRTASMDNLNRTNKKKSNNVSNLNITYDTFQYPNPAKNKDYMKKKGLIKDYKEILNKDFLKIIEKEKEKESLRESLILRAQNKEEKQKLENAHNIERAKSYKLITQMNKYYIFLTFITNFF